MRFFSGGGYVSTIVSLAPSLLLPLHLNINEGEEEGLRMSNEAKIIVVSYY